MTLIGQSRIVKLSRAKMARTQRGQSINQQSRLIGSIGADHVTAKPQQWRRVSISTYYGGTSSFSPTSSFSSFLASVYKMKVYIKFHILSRENIKISPKIQLTSPISLKAPLLRYFTSRKWNSAGKWSVSGLAGTKSVGKRFDSQQTYRRHFINFYRRAYLPSPRPDETWSRRPFFSTESGRFFS